MKRWERSPRRLVCGRCAGAIQIGDPVYVVANPEKGWQKHRCVTCAGEPVPTDLPALETRTFPGITATVKTPKPKSFTKLGGLAMDWKAKQAGK